MNLRQKAKNYKRLYEDMSPRKPVPVHFRHISGQQHLRVVRYVSPWAVPHAGEVEQYLEHERCMKQEMVRELEDVLLNSITYNEEERLLELDVWVKG